MLDTLTRGWTTCPRSGCWSCPASSSKGGGTGVQRARTALSPAAAAVLNVTQDHLDWHGSMAAYAAAKARMFGRPGA
jgi:UDP-N-acetylmuramyl tripeptide synthase